ncbi:MULTISPECIES: universal stress protein [Kitasatospora]|uniref:UspA domain-containing protein n=1 Tax=Kitasatospora setae (strain ATCC 33774 / DSM 43861 / JCM 3304 / KCC A-0304 / NBRC 14216 / KM-6054) TaxID=452652 RepID=E4NE01_KITSK|nr:MULTISPECIES: universal stress protein [Kitasatospora]BAJ29432.1 hypothetical protein KSE_36280 [Kitasatospora setae KM-6054]
MRVVVGVSGSPGSLAALHRAVAEARRAAERGGAAQVLALHAWEPPGGEFGYRRSPFPPLLSAVREEAERRLREAVAETGADRAGVPVTALTVRAAPATALLTAADRPDDLLVLGPAGTWWHRGLRASVPAHCVRRSRCPVLVVPRPELALLLDGLTRRAVDAELRDLVARG